MAKLKAVVDSLDGLEDGIKGLYVEQDGKFILDAEGVDNSGLKSALDKERKASRDAEAKRKETEARFSGIDPDRYAELLDAHEKAEANKGTLDEQAQKRAQKAIDAANKERDEALAAVGTERNRAKAYQGRVLDDAIRAAAAKAGLHQHAIDDALFRGRAMFTLDDNGNAVQLDSDGQPVIGKDGKTPFAPNEWLDSMRESAPHWFPAGASGTGSGNGNKGSGTTGSGKPVKDWSPREKSDFITKNGPAAFHALPR